MSRIQVILALLLSLLAPLGSAAAGPVQATPEAWLEQMLDGRRNGVAFKDPSAFAEWLDAITEPRFMSALATASLDPNTYPKALSDAMDPATARNWSEFTDPQLYLRWMLASTSPSFQQAIVSRLTDPAKMKRWVEFMNRPETVGPLLSRFAGSPGAWLAAPMNGANYAPVARMLQPATPLAWFDAMAQGVARSAGQGKDWQTLPEARMAGLKASATPRYRY